jgi:primosomal protein N' (replication factor Y)
MKDFMFADISFNLPFDRLFTYQVPYELQENLKVGSQVTAPFLKDSKKLGVVVKIHTNIPSFAVKDITKILETYTLPHYAVDLAHFIKDYYICSFNEALHLFIISSQTKLREKKEIPFVYEPVETGKITLNEEQQEVFDKIVAHSKNLTQFHVGLIWGITASGKTEIYQKLLQEVITKKKQALLLLPEIALTAQTTERFENYFGKTNLCVIHSQLGESRKRALFKKIQNNEYSIIIGPRSALFSPFANLGLIIIDEENDFSYKSSRSPRYNAKNVAYALAKKLNIPLLMGSATPSLEVFHAAKEEIMALYTLKQRFFKTPLPKVHLLDMTQETSVFSKTLMTQILLTYKKQQQSLLFINRRGFSPILLCKNCQNVIQCPYCSISLTYHKSEEALHCHYCGYKEVVPQKCPECQEPTLQPQGFGTQRIFEEIKELFHHLKVLRMDKDTTSKKNQHQEIIQAFREKKADILIGTQMITKGLDFPHVTLVGVLSCDTVLNLPDFRNAEYIFSLLTQVAGRSGRKSEGQVFIQTRYPNHYAVKMAQNHDYESFYKMEIKKREKYRYPPFFKMIRIIVRSKDPSKSEDITIKLCKKMKETFKNVEIKGPSSCVIEKIADQYRNHFFFKVKNPITYSEKIKTLLKEFQSPSYHVEVDVDPITML